MTDKTETALDAIAGEGGYGLGKVCDHLRFKFKRDGKGSGLETTSASILTSQ